MEGRKEGRKKEGINQLVFFEIGDGGGNVVKHRSHRLISLIIDELLNRGIDGVINFFFMVMMKREKESSGN